MRLLAAIPLLLAHVASAQPHDSVRARHLRWAALDQQAVLNLDSALVLVQAARRADPWYFAAQVDYLYLRHTRYEHATLRREAMALTRSADSGARCLGFVMAGVAEYRSVYRELLSLERLGSASTSSMARGIAIYRASRGVSAASSRRGFDRAQALGIEGSYTLIPRGLHGAAVRRGSGAIIRLPQAQLWIDGVGERVALFQAASRRRER